MGDNATRASRRVLIHVERCGAMSKEVIRGSGVRFALMNGDAIEVILLRFWRCMNIPEHLKRNQFMRFIHSADTYDIICVAISYIFVRCRSM